MDSPAFLLKVAVSENDPEARMQQVVRACKLITDVLPFDKKNYTLLEEPELLKYLLLAIPLNPRVIDMIITSMINKFKQLPFFMKEIWNGFLTVASLEEPGNVHIPKSETAVRHFQHGVKKLLNIMTLKDLDSVPTTPSNRYVDYCDDINKKKELMKLAVLDYVEAVLVFYTKEMKKSAAFKPDIGALVKKFITYTPSDKVIVRICSVMEKVSFFSKDTTLNQEIEELVVTKQSMVFDQQKYASRTSLDENRKSLSKSNLYSKTKGKLLHITEASRRLGDDLPSSHRKQELTPRNEDHLTVSFNPKMHEKIPKSELSVEDNDILAQSHYDDFETSVDSVEGRLDEWLSWGELDETPLIAKSNFIYNILRNPGNFEVILAFIFDPHCYPIGECWKAKYPSIAESLDENSILNQSSSSPFFKLQKLKDDKSLQPYMMRSFRAMQALCDVRNMKIITQTNPKAFESYFGFLYTCVNSKEDNMCNFNHIAKLTEYLFKKEPDVCVNYIIYYNLLYKFAQHIEFPCVQEFFLTIFNCAHTNNRITDNAMIKTLKYCRIVHFFSDLAQAILTGPKGLDIKKCEADYKPNGVESLIHGSMNISDLQALFSEKPISYRASPRDALLEDELNGYNLDIDNLYSTLDSKTKIDKQTLTIQKSFEKKFIPKSIMNKYYSLRQKYIQNERILGDLQDDDLTKTKDSFNQNNDMKGTSYTGSFKRLNDSTDLGKPQLGRGKTSVLLQTKKTRDSLLNESGQIPRGYVMSNASDSINSLQMNDKSIRPSSKQKNSFERLKTSESKRDPLRSTFDPRRADNFRSLKTKMTTDPSEDYGSPSLPQISNANRSNQTFGSRQHLEMRRAVKDIYYNPAPERMTLSKEYLTDVMSFEEAKVLNVLYPITNVTRIENDVDKEAKNPDFSANCIRGNEGLSVPLCNLLEGLIRKVLFTPVQNSFEKKNSFTKEDNGKKFRSELKKKLGYLDVDYAPFWKGIFYENSKFFELMLKNYLFKIKVHHLEETDSGYISGTIINLILERCESHPHLKEYFEDIHGICKEHVKFLCKVIIQSHAWPARKELNVYLQNYEVTEPLGTGRILLVETLYSIIKNDHSNHYKIVDDINDTCWHTLIIWFFSKKTNNIYHRIFYSILELTFLNCNEKFILTILLKLELLANLYKIWKDIYQNNVYLKDNHIESLLCYLKKIAKLIDSVAQKNENYVTLRNQLAASISWSHMKPILCPSKGNQKKESTIAHGAKNLLSVKSKDPQILRLSPQPNSRTSQNSHIRSRPDSRGISQNTGIKGSHSSVQLIQRK